ncbi:hypothetical protein T07_7915 [Trichinella nelsoni]|uniref:Uncharacterized protein n=1 Tax=Trichinella nelsoni TaxID=6336 RepID=A0A0V0RKC4_9BILA|nr:hypothetical protein T07_7915 [Trichinella nelsoni]
MHFLGMFRNGRLALGLNNFPSNLKYKDKIMLNRGRREISFGVAFFCTEHIHFCSFFGKLYIVLGYMIGGGVREMSGGLLVSVTVAPAGFLRMQ